MNTFLGFAMDKRAAAILKELLWVAEAFNKMK